MNSQNKPDWERRFQELETEVNQESNDSSVRSMNVSDYLESTVSRLKAWFEGLPNIGRVAVAIMAALVVLSLLNTVLKLVASLISIAILGVVLYLLYRFFLNPRSPE